MTEQALTSEQINCWIYRSSRKDEMYLYLTAEDAFDDVPEVLLKSFGKPEFVMELTLSVERTLARADVATVMASLKEDKFYFQMPPEINPDLHFGD